MIGIKTAMILFALLFMGSFWALKGPARYFCWIIIGGLAAKALLYHYRSRIE